MDSTKCGVCSSTKEIKLCSGCKTVAYCSLAHQKQHWKIHKKTCYPVKIAIRHLKDEEKAFIDGQGDEREDVDEIMLTRDLKAGSVILDDVPILTIPMWEDGNLVCLTCGIPLTGGDKIKNCSKCNWPICSKECEEVTLTQFRSLPYLNKKTLVVFLCYRIRYIKITSVPNFEN